MILTSTDSVEGRKITAYLGIVAGEAVMGTNIFRDFFAGITDILGGRSGSYEKELRKAKALALESLTDEARSWVPMPLSASTSITSRSAATNARC